MSENERKWMKINENQTNWLSATQVQNSKSKFQGKLKKLEYIETYSIKTIKKPIEIVQMANLRIPEKKDPIETPKSKIQAKNKSRCMTACKICQG